MFKNTALAFYRFLVLFGSGVVVGSAIAAFGYSKILEAQESANADDKSTDPAPLTVVE